MGDRRDEVESCLLRDERDRRKAKRRIGDENDNVSEGVRVDDHGETKRKEFESKVLAKGSRTIDRRLA